MKEWLRILVLAGGLLAATSAMALDPEVEEAYKKGQADWDRGDPSSAMGPLKKAADAGHPAAQALYAFLLDQADNDTEAAAYYRKAAEQGNTEGMSGLAGLYAAGDGVKQDYAEARRWYTEAANGGHKQSIVVLSSSYIRGLLGLEAAGKSAEGLPWVKAAADLDHVPSLQRLVEAYRNGEMGLAVDTVEADRLQQRINKLQGIDPAAPKKRRRRS